MKSGSDPDRIFRLTCLGCLLIGGAARIWGYATSGSLWLDELFIANNLRELSFTELFSPLKYGQNAPIGWLAIQKLILSLFGDEEYVLRFAGLLASLVSLPLAYAVSKRIVGVRYAILPVAIVAFSPFVVWQGIQVKQYTFDLLVSLAVLALAIRAERNSSRAPVALGVAGFVGIWISMPSVFVLGGVGLVLFGSALFSSPRNRGRLIQLTVMGGAWIVAFAINYLVFLRPGSQEGWLQHFWARGFFDWPIDSLSDLWWLPNVLSAAMSNPVGFFKIGMIALLPVLFGLALFFRRSDRMKTVYLGMVTIPILLTLFAAILGLYPFAVRLVLFLVPNLALLFALGIRELARIFPRGRTWIYGATFVMVAVPLGLFLLWLPRGGLPIASDTRELVRILETKALPGDAIVVDHLAYHAWRYYGTFSDDRAIEARSAWNDTERMEAIREVFAELPETRAWVMISRISEHKPRSLKQSLKEDLGQRNPTLPETYEWFVGKETKWTPIEIYERGLPGDWKIRETVLVYGGCLWLLERTGVVGSDPHQ